MKYSFLSILIFLFFFSGVWFFFNTSHALTESAVSDRIPWSGYWWPTTRGGLATGDGYRGSPAPLQKYDLIFSGTLNGPATSHYLTHNYDTGAASWSGLCDAWASAAISEAIDFVPSSVSNLVFRIGDKKGLMTLAYQLSYQTDQFQNIDSPLIFHQWLQRYIRDRKTAFVAELDPSEQLWNYPLYRYDMDIIDFGDQEMITCTVSYADDNVDPDYSGVKERNKTYYYSLYKSGIGYTSSEWGMQNSYDHPSYVFYPESAKLGNPGLDYNNIKMIAQSMDDEIESSLPVAVTPGTYNLILLNEDRYLLDPGGPGTVSVRMTVLDDTGQAIDIHITDARGLLVYSGSVADTVQIQLTAGEPPFDMTVSRGNYDHPGIYSLTCDVSKNYQYVRAKAQKGYGWGGYALVNTSASAISDIMISGYKNDGTAVDTFLGPMDLAPGEKRVVLSSDFPYRNQLEKEDFFGVKIHAPENISMVNLSGDYPGNMAAFSRERFSSTLVIPEYPDMFDFSMIKTWGIYNPGVTACSISFLRYSRNGDSEDSTEVSFDPGEIRHYTSQSSPLSGVSDNGWVLVQSDNELSGYEEWLSRSGASNETIPALIPGRVFYLPNPAESGGWQTTVTLINTTESDNTVTLQLLSPDFSVSSSELVLKPFQKMDTSVSTLFPDLSAFQVTSGYLKIEAAGDVAGFYRYTAATGTDTMTMLLSGPDDLKTALVIPHVASSSDWWTGMVLCNAGNATADVTILPFRQNGELIGQSTVSIELGEYGKLNALIAGLFDSRVIPEIAYIKIQSANGVPIFGTYGFGAFDLKMLAGSKM